MMRSTIAAMLTLAAVGLFCGCGDAKKDKADKGDKATPNAKDATPAGPYAKQDELLAAGIAAKEQAIEILKTVTDLPSAKTAVEQLKAPITAWIKCIEQDEAAIKDLSDADRAARSKHIKTTFGPRLNTAAAALAAEKKRLAAIPGVTALIAPLIGDL